MEPNSQFWKTTIKKESNKRPLEKRRSKGQSRDWPLSNRVLANHSLSSTASQGTTNIPFPWFLLLGCNRQTEKRDITGGSTTCVVLHLPAGYTSTDSLASSPFLFVGVKMSQDGHGSLVTRFFYRPVINQPVIDLLFGWVMEE